MCSDGGETAETERGEVEVGGEAAEGMDEGTPASSHCLCRSWWGWVTSALQMGH